MVARSMGGEGCAHKGTAGGVLEGGVLYPNYGGDYAHLPICPNPQNCTVSRFYCTLI